MIVKKNQCDGHWYLMPANTELTKACITQKITRIRMKVVSPSDIGVPLLRDKMTVCQCRHMDAHQRMRSHRGGDAELPLAYLAKRLLARMSSGDVMR